MVEIVKLVFVFTLGIILLVKGLKIIQKGRFEIGIGGGRVVSRPLITLQIKGTGAITFGTFSIISGSTSLIYLVLSYINSNSTFTDASISIAISIMVGLVVLGLILGGCVQVLMDISKITQKRDPNQQ
jgi:hypothetical protein